jgi:multicomponent Na+:H+ antiporter subunit E
VSKPRPSFALAAALFAFWVALSGKFDLIHLALGIATAVFISQATGRLMRLPPAMGPPDAHPFSALPWLRLAAYLPWLGWQILLSSIQVARVVFDPRLPISPAVIHFRYTLPHTVARLTLANSITLTPGTVTLDVEGDEYVIHALIESAGRSLAPGEDSGDMPRRVERVYRTSRRAQVNLE